MSTELTKRDHADFANRNLDYIQRLAKMMVASRFFKDAEDLAKASVKIMAGQELGLSPITSLRGVYLVKGKVAYESGLIGAAIRRNGYDYRVRTLTNDACTIEFFNGQKESLGVSTFTMEDARLAGVTSNDNYKKYPRNMLFGRALTNGARWYCPDVFSGSVYTPEELGATYDAEGSVIEHEIETEQPRQETPRISSEAADLNSLLSGSEVAEESPVEAYEGSN